MLERPTGATWVAVARMARSNSALQQIPYGGTVRSLASAASIERS